MATEFLNDARKEIEGRTEDFCGAVSYTHLLENQKSELDVMLAKKKQESANYDAEIKKAKQEASVAKALLQQEQKQLKQLQARAQQGNTAAATGTYATTNYTSVIESASGSDMGKRLAKYACQYIGNPYVCLLYTSEKGRSRRT